jgi:hypothetical protein
MQGSGTEDSPFAPDQAGPGRSLIAVGRDPCESPPLLPLARPLAAFIAHLVATRQDAPQTRARRRAQPETAAALYAAAATAPGRAAAVERFL